MIGSKAYNMNNSNTFPEELSFIEALYNRCKFGSFQYPMHISNNTMEILKDKGYKIDKLGSAKYVFHKTQMFNKESHVVRIRQN